MATRRRQLGFASGPGSYPLVRMAGCLLALAADWFYVRPLGAVLASVVILLSFALVTSCAVDVLVWLLIVPAAAMKSFSWPVASLLALLPVLLVPLLLVLADVVHKLLPSAFRDIKPLVLAPYGRIAVGQVLRKWVRVAIPLLALAAILVLRGWWNAVLLAVPALLLAKGRFAVAAAWCAVVWLVHGTDAAVLGMLALAVAGVLAPALTPRPVRHLPLPGPRLRDGPRMALRLRRADRALRHHDNHRAQRILQAVQTHTADGTRPEWCARVALNALDDGRYQDASEALGRAADTASRCAQVLAWLRSEVLAAMNRQADAADLLSELHEARSRCSRNERVCYGLSLALALGRTGRHARAIDLAEAALAQTRFWGWTLERAQAYRIIAEAELARGRTAEALARAADAQGILLTNWWVQYLWRQGGNQHRFYRLATGPNGRLFTEVMKAEILYRSISVELPEQSEGPYTIGNMDAHCGILAIQGQWEILADLLVAQARFLCGQQGQESAALACLLRALREVDRNRHKLNSPRDRAAWSTRLHRALAVALSLTVESGDARLQAELMEFGRVQTLPYLQHEADEDQIVLAVPPAIRIRGQAQLIPYWDANRPSPVDLEAAAAAVAGADAWWLAYWQADEWLYWTLVPPSGSVEGGRIDFSPASELQRELLALRCALPVELDGETIEDFDVRLEQLLGDPAAERLRSSHLAQLLLPGTLLTHLRSRLHGPATSGSPLPLAIVPSAALAFMPWSMLALGDCEATDASAPARLVHAADWVLAPAASLATNLPPQPTADRYPLRFAVADTWESKELGALPAARHQAQSLPPGVEVLGGAHWAGRTATEAALRAAITRAGPASTALFACHAVPAQSDLTAPGGLVLAEEDAAGGPKLLTAAKVLAMASDGITMPAQALLLACDTSNLAASAAGEWLTTAPAMLAAGSITVVTTVYPLLDVTINRDPVLAAAIEGKDLRAAVRAFQCASASEWDARGAGRLDVSPLIWASYAVVSAHHGQPRKADRRTPRFSRRMRKLLYKAASQTLSLHGRTVNTGTVLAAYLTGPAGNPHTAFSAHGIMRDAGLGLAARILPEPSYAKDPRGLAPSQKLLDALRGARELAAREARDIEPEDLIRAALTTKSLARRLARGLTLARLQRTDHILNLLEHTLVLPLPDHESARPRKERPDIAAFIDQLPPLIAFEAPAAFRPSDAAPSGTRI